MNKNLILIVLIAVLSRSKAFDLTNIHAVKIDGVDYLEFRRVTSATDLKTYLEEITNQFIHASNRKELEISTIKRLSLNNSSLSEIPLELFSKFRNLTVLKAENIGLETFNEESAAIKLNDLSLANNKLKHFENMNILELYTLNLSGNELEVLNLTLSSVITIDLSRNKLKEVAISGSVTNLNIAENQIERIVIPKNSSLEVLNLSRNALKTDDLLQLQELKELKTLDLSECGLTSLNFDSFAHLESLQTLQLDKNAISGLSYGVFAHQKMLKRLNLSGNVITTLDLHHYEDLKALNFLDISYNNISKIDDYDKIGRDFLENLKAIDIDGNPWPCKYLVYLMRSLNTKKFVDRNEQIKGMEVNTPEKPVKNRPNIRGVECIEGTDEAESKITQNVEVSEKIIEIQIKLKGVEESLAKNSQWLTVVCMIGIVCVAIAVYKFVAKTFGPKRFLRRSQCESTNPFEQEQLNVR